MKKITLYHNGPSTCSQKVRIILDLKKIEYKSKLINLFTGEQHSPEYVKLNPNHLVPTLVVDNDVLLESSLINEYLEDMFPEISARPSDHVRVHQMRLWIKYVDIYHPQCGSITYGIGPPSNGSPASPAADAAAHAAADPVRPIISPSRLRSRTPTTGPVKSEIGPRGERRPHRASADV